MEIEVRIIVIKQNMFCYLSELNLKIDCLNHINGFIEISCQLTKRMMKEEVLMWRVSFIDETPKK